MSAAGVVESPQPYTFVRIKRVPPPGVSAFEDEVFAKVPIRSTDDVADLAARVCETFGWGPPTRAGLFLVAAGGSIAPTPTEIAAALGDATKRLGERLSLADAVASGAWLVARVPAPAPAPAIAPGGGRGGGAPVTIAGGAGGGIISLDDLRAVVRAEVRAPAVESVSISEATPAVMSGLLETAGIFEASNESVGAVPADFLPALRAFDWRRGESTSTADACARLSEYLAAAGAPMAPAAVPGFKVVDVHTRSVLTTQLGRIRLTGGTDAIVVPSTQADDFASQQARVVVDFKVDASVFVDVLGQAEAELVAASSLSHHDVMVVFTDLNQHGHVLRAEGGRLLIWKNLSVRETVFLVADFLSAQCARVGVPNLDDDRVPGAPDAKKRRIALSVALHGMRPTNEALMDQLEAFHGGAGVDEYLQGRALVLGALGIEGYEGGWTPSYSS